MNIFFWLSWAGASHALALFGGIFSAQLVSAQDRALISQGQLSQNWVLSDGIVHSNVLVRGGIHADFLAIGSIHSNYLAIGSVHSNTLALVNATASALAAGNIHSNYLALGLVHSNALVRGSIHSNFFAVGSIHSNHLAIGSVHSNILALVNETANALGLGNIHSNHLVIGIVHSNVLVLGRIDSVNDTVGQADVLSGDIFTLEGGLWVFLPVETFAAPRLIITRDPVRSITTVAWPSPSPGFMLQQNASLVTTNWVAAPHVVGDDGTHQFVTVNSAAGNYFYRLFRP